MSNFGRQLPIGTGSAEEDKAKVAEN